MIFLTQALLAIQAIHLVASLAIATRHDGNSACDAHHHGDCIQKGKHQKWTVHDFDYHAEYIFTTPAHQNSHGYANFNISNTAVPYVASCSATSDQLTDFFYGTQWYPCALPSTAPTGAAVSFRYNRPTGQLDVNEAIVCEGKMNATQSTLRAAGTSNLTLTCTDQTWTNPNWTYDSGDFYSEREVKCAPVDVMITPYQVV